MESVVSNLTLKELGSYSILIYLGHRFAGRCIRDKFPHQIIDIPDFCNCFFTNEFNYNSLTAFIAMVLSNAYFRTVKMDILNYVSKTYSKPFEHIGGVDGWLDYLTHWETRVDKTTWGNFLSLGLETYAKQDMWYDWIF